jgi:DNA polymerase-2
VIQPTYRIEANRPVIHIWGRLERGDTFLIRDDRLRPHFYVRSADTREAFRLGATNIDETELVTIEGEPVSKVEVGVPSNTPPLRDRLHRAGLSTFEADVRFGIRYLIDHKIRGSLVIEGEWQTGEFVDRVYRNPEIGASDWVPELKVVSIDIETNFKTNSLLSVALFGSGANEVILVSGNSPEVLRNTTLASDEGDLLRELGRRVRELDPDILTGWNVAGFDLRILAQRAAALQVPLELGRAPGAIRIQSARGPIGSVQASIPGRLVLDGPHLLRGAFIRMERLSLDFVARQVLGEGKTVSGSNRAEAILDMFKHERKRFVEYNLTDARLAFEILDKLKLFDLSIARSQLTGMPLDRVASSIASFDFLYLLELADRGMVAPSVRSDTAQAQSFGGGHVFEPEPGLYDYVAVLDFKSLYPSLIRTFQLDPIGFVATPDQDGDYLFAPNGAAFRRQRGVLTELLDELFPRRERAKLEGREVESTAIKILMNSFYGVLGTTVCRFYNPQIAEAITSFGRTLLRWSRDQIQSWGYDVLYGDTDSLFVRTGAEVTSGANRIAGELAHRLNDALAAFVLKQWGVDSCLEAEFETLYLRLFLPPIRHGSGGARKRYAGLVEKGSGTQVVFTGLEAVRRDWTELARTAQQELYDRMFRGEAVVDYLKSLVAELRRGERDDQLVYRKALRKPLDSYTSTTPPHVAAARKMSGEPDRLISYLITESGPEPASERRSRIDYQHYVDKQLRPVAEPVLAELGLDFAKACGEDRQLDLF